MFEIVGDISNESRRNCIHQQAGGTTARLEHFYFCHEFNRLNIMLRTSNAWCSANGKDIHHFIQYYS